jgi:anti-sigma factor RsiW
MLQVSEALSEADLHAYVDDQLDMSRRIEVEDYLSRHPEIAARVMADLRIRDSLRLALLPYTSVSATRTRQAARRLRRRLVWTRFARRGRHAAAVAVLITVGWLAHAQMGPFGVGESTASPSVPAFVEEAWDARRISLLRAQMRSQPEVTHYDPVEILAMTQIAIPDLPRDWRVLDVQVFPTADDYSVEMSLEAGPLGTLSLFATRVEKPDLIKPIVVPAHPATTAYWQMGPLAYALTGSASQRALKRAAVELSETLH